MSSDGSKQRTGLFGLFKGSERETPSAPPAPKQKPAPEEPAIDLLSFGPADPPVEPDLEPEDPTVESMTGVLYRGVQGLLSSTPPSFPWFASQVLEAVEQPDIEIAVLARLVSRDALIATQVLRVANSAQYSRGARVHDVKDAISRLGLREVANIAAIASAQALISPASREATALYPKLSQAAWVHSIACSLSAGWLSSSSGQGQPPIAFMGGLLHDIGKIVGLQALGLAIHAGKLPKLGPRKASRLLEATHLEVGVQVADMCKFPESVFVMCRYHHEPHRGTAEHQRELHITALVAVLEEIMSGRNVDDAWVAATMKSVSALQLDETGISALVKQLKDSRAKAASIMTLSA